MAGLAISCHDRGGFGGFCIQDGGSGTNQTSSTGSSARGSGELQYCVRAVTNGFQFSDGSQVLNFQAIHSDANSVLRSK